MKHKLSWGACALVAAGCVATPAAAQNFDTILSIFSLGQFLSNDNPEANFDPDGGDSSTTGTFNGQRITITATDGTTLDQVPGRQSIRLTVNGDAVTITTDASSFGATGSGSTTTIEGNLQGVSIDASVQGNLQSIPDSSRISGTLNGESIVIELPSGVTFRQLQPGNTQVDLTVDGEYLGEFSIFVNDELVFSGTVAELEGDAMTALRLVSVLNLLNPVTNLSYEAQQVQTGLVLQSVSERIATVFGAPGGSALLPSFEAASLGLRPDEPTQLAMDRDRSLTDLGTFVSAVAQSANGERVGDRRASFGLWADFAYTAFENGNDRYRSDGDIYGFRVGGDALLQRRYLVGLALGFDRLQSDAGVSNRGHLELDAFNVSPYAAVSLFDGLLVSELVLNYARLDVSTITGRGLATRADGETQGDSYSGRLGATVNHAVLDGSVLLSGIVGLQGGYQSIDGFTDSRGIEIDRSQTPMAEADVGARASARLLPSLAVSGRAAYVFDFSDSFDDSPYLAELSENYVELGGGVTWSPLPAASLGAGGSVKLGLDDREEYTLRLDASYRF